MEGVVRVRDRPGAPHPHAGEDRDAADAEDHFDRLETYRVQQQYFVQRQVGSGPARPGGAAVLACPEHLAQLAQVGLFAFRAAQRRHVRAHDARLTVEIGGAMGRVPRTRLTSEPSREQVM